MSRDVGIVAAGRDDGSFSHKIRGGAPPPRATRNAWPAIAPARISEAGLARWIVDMEIAAAIDGSDIPCSRDTCSKVGSPVANKRPWSIDSQPLRIQVKTKTPAKSPGR